MFQYTIVIKGTGEDVGAVILTNSKKFADNMMDIEYIE